MSKTCVKCGSINDERYSFCKNCGTPLGEEPVANGYTVYSEPVTEPPPPVDTVDGVPVENLATFIGKNSYSYISKFSKMELTRTNVSFNWPVALLSFFFGLFGAALWFLYRKMYKTAFGILAAALALSLLGNVITFNEKLELYNSALDYNYAMQAADDSQEMYVLFMQYIEDVEQISVSPSFVLVDTINNAARLVYTTVLALFANAIYKKHAVRQIQQYSAKNGLSEYYNFGMASLGGTSAGMVVLGVIIMLVLPILLEMVPVFTVIMNGGW